MKTWLTSLRTQREDTPWKHYTQSQKSAVSSSYRINSEQHKQQDHTLWKSARAHIVFSLSLTPSMIGVCVMQRQRDCACAWKPTTHLCVIPARARERACHNRARGWNFKLKITVTSWMTDRVTTQRTTPSSAPTALHPTPRELGEDLGFNRQVDS